MKDQEIIEAIRNATNGTFMAGYGATTCMGWVDHYDKQGRCVTADPNTRDGQIIIDGQEYKLFRKGWYAWIVRPEYADKVNYMNIVRSDLTPKETFVGNDKIDLRPDYVKEYEEEKRKEYEENLKKNKETTDKYKSEIKPHYINIVMDDSLNPDEMCIVTKTSCMNV